MILIVCLFIALVLASGEHYIVLFKHDIRDRNVNQHFDEVAKLVGQSTYTGVQARYDFAKGYFAHLPAEVVERLRTYPEVEMVVKESTVKAHIIPRPQNIHELAPIEILQKREYDRNQVQSRARPGLTRICHKSLEAATEWKQYLYLTTPIAEITIYNPDSGVRISHTEFGGRVSFGATFGGDLDPNDFNGHGTHTMAIALGSTLGVARSAKGVSVKILNGNGDGLGSSVIAALDWVMQQPGNPNAKIINLSFGGEKSVALNEAIDRVIRAGIHVIVAAGNEMVDVNTESPSSSSAIVVGGIDDLDQRPSYSNYGSNVRLVAPSENVESAWFTGDNAASFQSGTSMAAPHVTGVLAYVMSMRGPLTPDLGREAFRLITSVRAGGYDPWAPAAIIYNGSGQ